MIEEKLAIEGGSPVRTDEFPSREPFSLEDATELIDTLRNQTAFFPSGKKEK